MKKIILFLFFLFPFLSSVECSNSMQHKLTSLERKQKFENILLVIHYNHAFYGSVKFLRDLYKPLFKENIVFYGPQPGENVHNIDVHNGYFFTRIMADVFQRYPNYKGYLFLQDDCVINYWNFDRLDTTKIWYGLVFNQVDDLFCNGINLKTGESLGKRRWYWWDFFLPSTQKAVANLSDKHVKQLHQNIGVDIGVGQAADMFYIPGRHALEALQLCILYQDVFCEIAVPMLIYSIEPIANIECLTMFWGFQENQLSVYPSHLDWIHPIKFSNVKNRDKISTIFKRFGR